MTPEQKTNLHTFLWDESMLYDEEEMKLIEKWIDENIVSENERIKEALKQAVKLIKQWHSRSIPMAGKLRTVVEDVWQTYYDHAPELKEIREVLKEK